MNSLQHLPLSFAYDLPFETLRLVESTPETPVHRFCSMDHVCLSQISKASKRSKRLEMGAASLAANPSKSLRKHVQQHHDPALLGSSSDPC